MRNAGYRASLWARDGASAFMGGGTVGIVPSEPAKYVYGKTDPDDVSRRVQAS
jgi:hypothetical protein